jgi:glycosyltransferase involved in cell wall biosynthesis
MPNRQPQRRIHVGLVSCYPPSTGPLSEYSYHLAQEYAKNPQISKVTIICDTVNKAHENPGSKIEIASSWNLDGSTAAISIVKKSLEVRPDVLHFNILFRQFSAHRLLNFLGLTTPAVLKTLGIPVVVTLHSLAEGLDIKEAGYSNSFFNRLGYTIATRLLLKADIVTVPHQRLIRILEERYKAHNTLLVPHGVFFRPIKNPKFSGKRLLLFGKIGPYKNPSLAVKAFKQVFLKDREAELLIAGSSHPFHHSFLESTVGSTDLAGIKFTGYVPEDRVEELFASAIAVLLPYTTPTWSSGTFTLASAFGRPVIASDLPDFRELMTEGAGIVLFPNGDSDALAERIEELVHDPGMQLRLGEANLAWARRHSFEDIANSLINLLYSISRPHRVKGG